MRSDPRIYSSLDDLLAMREPAQKLPPLSRQVIANLRAGRHQSASRGRGLDFAELRQYRDGDDIRDMDWRATQRTGKPHVRLNSEEKERTVILCVDQRSSMFFGSRERLKSVTAAQVAALLGWRLQADHDRVGAVLFNDDQQVYLSPQNSQAHLEQICDKLAGLNHQLAARPPAPDANSKLDAALEFLQRCRCRGCLIVVISDWYGFGNQTATICRQLSEQNQLLNIQVRDPLEADLSPMGRFVAGNGMLRFDVQSAAVRLTKAFTAQSEQKREQLQEQLRRCQAPLLTLDTEAPVQNQLRHALLYPGGTA